jgi:Ca2+-binding RTX toxin-like protein
VLGNNVDDLHLLGDQDLNGTGNDLNNFLWGNEGANVLFGGIGLDYLMGDDGEDILYGGQGTDWLYGEDGDDMILAGQGADYLSGGEGNDELQGGMQDDTLYGEGGADLLLAGQGNDVLFGGTGNDMLNGARGSDILTGDDGEDTFAFSTALSSDAVDTIKDFSVTDDNIMLSNGIFTQLTQANLGTTFVKNATGVAGAGQYLIYNTAAHTLSYDADANGAGAAVMVALDGSAGNTMDAITASSFVIV